jgi:hypothetical protein
MSEPSAPKSPTRRLFLGGALAAALAAAIGIKGGRKAKGPRRPPIWIGHM